MWVIANPNPNPNQVGLGDELSVLAFKEMIEEASSVDVGYS